MSESGDKTRWYTFAKWWVAAPVSERLKVSRQKRCHLRRVAKLAPTVGGRVDELRLSFRWARWIAHGRLADQAVRLAVAERAARGEVPRDELPEL